MANILLCVQCDPYFKPGQHKVSAPEAPIIVIQCSVFLLPIYISHSCRDNCDQDMKMLNRDETSPAL